MSSAVPGTTSRRRREICWVLARAFPALIISPFAKRGTVDHTQYDTESILRLITRRFGLDVLPGIAQRDAGLRAHGAPAMGDLTDALELR